MMLPLTDAMLMPAQVASSEPAPRVRALEARSSGGDGGAREKAYIAERVLLTIIARHPIRCERGARAREALLLITLSAIRAIAAR